jgi:hypothetical protein
MEGIEKQSMSTPIPSGFTVMKRMDGIVNTMGKAAGLEQNWGYFVKDEEGTECILMYCNPGHYTIIDIESLPKVRNVNDKQVSWFIGKNGYPGCRTVMNGKDTVLTLHQHLMNHYGHGKGQESIDHINRNKLDNRLQNLRITSQSIQNENRDKVRRQKNAKELPDEIKEIGLPKFVVYYKENVGKDNTREFFTVEGHPLQKEKEKGTQNHQTNQLKSRRWATTKSNKVCIKDKLDAAKRYIIELNSLVENPSYKMKEIENVITTELTQPESISIHVAMEMKEDTTLLIPVIPVQPFVHNTTTATTFVPPKQWKVKQIYKAISTNQENQYKEHCEKNNDLSTLADWPSTWASFVLSIKGNTLAESETIIREFVENLRSMRHNQLCYKKNSSLVNREDREQWPATTVVRTFLDGKMNVFKKHTEIQTGDNPDDPLWQTRWNNFVESLEKNRENHKNMKELCSQFLTAQRTKRYRRNKINN